MSGPSDRQGGEPAATARSVAARVVSRVLGSQVFLSDVLDAELQRAALEPRDRALATELSYGSVRLERALSKRLAALAPRGVAKGDALAQAHLLVAAYQILALDRVPAFAAVNEAVAALSKLRGDKLAGFANAVLRRLAEQRADFSSSEALAASVEPWLYEELCRSVGAGQALSLLGAASSSPHRGLCVRFAERVRDLPAWTRAAEPGKLAPRAYWLPPSGDPRRLEGFAEGQFVVQEEGAQWAALALGARPGERVLDACAGHGQKSAILAERLGGAGRLWVNDIAPSKLERLRREFERLGLCTPEFCTVDLTASPGGLPADMDRVLVDAPCTGTGTLRRRPEILRRLGPGDPARLAERARLMLRHAAARARPGGRVLFVVCSVLRAECEDVADSVREVLEPAPFDAPEAIGLLGPGATACRLSPATHGTDGYYVASFLRRG